MADLVIRPLDASDPDALTAWHATYLAADSHGREHATPWMKEEMRADFLGVSPGETFLPFAGSLDGEVVATGLLVLPQKDNRHLAWCMVWTHPDHRRNGHGTAMLEHATQLAHDAGRTTLTTETATPYAGPADGAGHPNADFLTRRGFVFDIGDVMRVIDLPADMELLERLADEAAPHHTEYTIRQFAGPVPDDIVAPFGELIGSLMTEAPMGELQREVEVMDEERLRADEKIIEESGRTKFTTVAIAGDGDVVAYSELVVPKHDPERVYQWGTLVAKAHRGHRLGMATKARNLMWVQAEEPDRTVLVTYNAEVNEHMIGVNDQMGFRPVERLVEFQKPIG